MTFNFHEAKREASEQMYTALFVNAYVPALFAPGQHVPAQEELCQWILEDGQVTAAQLMRAVEAGTLRAWYSEFADVWADSRAHQLKRLHAIGEEAMLDAMEGWQ